MIPRRIALLMKEAVKIAADSRQTMERRLVAISLLSHGAADEAGAALQKLIDPTQPSEIQIAAVRALSQMSDPDVAANKATAVWVACSFWPDMKL